MKCKKCGKELPGNTHHQFSGPDYFAQYCHTHCPIVFDEITCELHGLISLPGGVKKLRAATIAVLTGLGYKDVQRAVEYGYAPYQHAEDLARLALESAERG